jgi:molecular chaperone GrpE
MKNEWDEQYEDEGPPVPREGEAAAAAGAASDERERLIQAAEQKAKEAAEANDKYLRVYAEFDNYRKRMQRDMAEYRKYANEQLVLELLTVVDSMCLALKHAAEASGAGEGLQQGVELVYKQLRDLLEKFGVKRFSAKGEPFDPAKHDAMMQVVTDEVPENSVVQVFQDGYVYHDKVLRHAKVSVSKKPQSEAVAASEP